MDGQLQASVSAAVTRQIRQYEPLNVHVTVQNVTAETPIEDVKALLDAKVKDVAALVAEWTYRTVTSEIQRLRELDSAQQNGAVPKPTHEQAAAFSGAEKTGVAY